MGKDLTAAIRAITESQRPAPGAKPALRGAARRVVAAAAAPGGASGGGGGGALGEVTEASREYYAAAYTSSDGLFTFPAIKSVSFSDGTDIVLKLSYLPPS